MISHRIIIQAWQEYARKIPEMNISKSDLTSTAILKFIQSYSKNNSSVDENDVELIRQLIYNVSSRRAIIKILVNGFKHISLSEFLNAIHIHALRF